MNTVGRVYGHHKNTKKSMLLQYVSVKYIEIL